MIDLVRVRLAFINNSVRRVKRGGREYIVAPLTMLVPGVLNGSSGPLYYPAEQVSTNVDSWNGMPIVLGHPSIDNEPVSARDPDVLDKVGMGHVYNTLYDGKLRAEGWFDYDLTRKVSPVTLGKLLKSEPIELSTGLFLKQLDAPEGSVYNGKAYTKSTSDYRPDHLAVLIGQVGACSIDDGCGVHVTNRSIDTGSGDTVSKSKLWRMLGKMFLGEGTTSKVSVVNKQSSVTPTSTPTSATPADTTSPFVGNVDVGHDQIRQEVAEQLRGRCTQADPYCYIMDVFDDYVIYSLGSDMFKLGYSVDDKGSVTLSSDDPEPVVRQITYVADPDDTGDDTDSSTSYGGMTTMALTANGKQNAQWLVANCDCWKDGLKSLEGMTDQQVANLKTAREQAQADAVIASAARTGATINVAGIPVPVVYNQQTGKMEVGQPQIPVAPPVQQQPQLYTVVNGQLVPYQPQAPTQPMQAGYGYPLPINNGGLQFQQPNQQVQQPQVMNETSQYVQDMMQRERGELVAKLTANMTPEARPSAAQIYNGMPLPTLRGLAAGVAQVTSIDPQDIFSNQPNIPIYNGAAAAGGYTNEEPAEVLEEQPIDWGNDPVIGNRGRNGQTVKAS